MGVVRIDIVYCHIYLSHYTIWSFWRFGSKCNVISQIYKSLIWCQTSRSNQKSTQWLLKDKIPVRSVNCACKENVGTTIVAVTLKYLGKSTSTKSQRYTTKRPPDSIVHGTNMGPTWVLSAPDEPHVGPINLAIWDRKHHSKDALWRCVHCLRSVPSWYVTTGILFNRQPTCVRTTL